MRCPGQQIRDPGRLDLRCGSPTTFWKANHNVQVRQAFTSFLFPGLFEMVIPAVEELCSTLLYLSRWIVDEKK